MSQDLTKAVRTQLAPFFIEFRADLDPAVYRVMEMVEPEITDLEKKIDQLTTERDELRAQVGILVAALSDAYHGWAEGNDVVGPMKQAKRVLEMTPQDAAQYVRGLEAALQRFIDDPTQPQSYNDMNQHHCAYCGMPAIYEQNRYFVKELRHTEDCPITKARQALVAKEDRG